MGNMVGKSEICGRNPSVELFQPQADNAFRGGILVP